MGAALVCLAAAHPEKLACKDPRAVEGGMMMHNYVVSNQYTGALLFSASATSYKAGATVELAVRANGTKYVTDAAPKGVFLAMQSRSACTLVGDHGAFTSMSGDLDLTPGCVSGVFSKTADGQFKGHSVATWTAGPGTVGDVTFTLLWSNGPGATDPLSVAGKVRVPDSYLLMKTITISGPAGPCPPLTPPPPPVLPGLPDKCVWSAGEAGGCPVAGARAPVFIQDLGEDGEATFPASRCMPCRIDHRGTCRSAMVTCPTEPGGPLEERIWASSRACEGPATRTMLLPPGAVRCPGPEHYSVDALDLERFVPKLLRDHGHHVKDEKVARVAVEEYRRMLHLIQRFPDRPVVPSKLVDLVWHEHILDTARYKRDCLRMFGRYVHHNPSFGGDEEKAELKSQQAEMFHLYRAVFEEPPSVAIWPAARRARLGAGGPLPDCCSAKCVKPACHDCVGCNSVDCGYLAGDRAAADLGVVKRAMSPDAFAGYVPTAPLPMNVSQSLRSPYLCSLSSPLQPYPMSLEWTICRDRIYLRQSLKGISAWYSVGISGRAPHDMGFGDYMLSMMSTNYTGVKDLYKYDAGNGYPCWDVLHECSVGNKTKGTKDVENDAIQRANGMTWSTWSRKLDTGDYKDLPIVRGNMTVMFAHGVEDYFTYHAKHRATCKVDFFSGLADCGATKAAATQDFI